MYAIPVSSCFCDIAKKRTIFYPFRYSQFIGETDGRSYGSFAKASRSKKNDRRRSRPISTGSIQRLIQPSSLIILQNVRKL